MKKTVAVLLVCILFTLLIPVSAADSAETESLPDGGYFVTETVVTPVSRGSLNTERRDCYYNTSGEKQWTMVLKGSFTYNGTTATCTSASVTYTIYNSNWHHKSHSAWASGNTANGTLTMEKWLFLTPVLIVSKSLTITCDANGNIS